MSNSIEQFKSFVRQHPQLKSLVRNGDATWQSIYEEWVLLGEDDPSWSNYRQTTTSTSGSLTESQEGQEFIKTALNYVKKINPDDISKYINNAQKILGIIQMFNGGGNRQQAPNPTGYRPRRQVDPLFRRFDD